MDWSSFGQMFASNGGGQGGGGEEPPNMSQTGVLTTNTGVNAVNNARIDDAAPTFTQFFGSSIVSAGNIAGGVKDTDGTITGGSIDGASITLQSGEALVLSFGVKLD